ncbi:MULTISPECIES: endonuclease [unclassified Pseudomonas]|uniref:endonuclease n=1 Tax=unclassified Pseudomonas TaxID=196821 RepID=UPI0014743681|nr:MULTISPECIES: endonuclease [unclassified Pseudomonas]NMX90980.1 endonuclease [Pseudomonas sp. WS 5086]NMY45416.1 endonuclease [Pseudomonas sp. WS 5027]
MPLRPTLPVSPFEYPAHLRAQAEAAPRAPGVYFFYAQGESMPLYIGKSVDLRSRLLAHLRNPEEARMLRQAQRIEYQQTAGEIGALLLESRLIKEMQPLKNKRLRRQRRLCSLCLHNGKLEIIDTTALTEGPQLYGLFRSRRMAIEALMLLADEHRLCHGLLGIEPPSAKGCFRAQIRKCAGACRGDETHAAHTERLLLALAHWAVHRWPYPAAIALHERHGQMEQYHVVDNWRYIGTYTSETEARLAPALPPQAFDADSYKILVRPVLFESARVVLLS